MQVHGGRYEIKIIFRRVALKNKKQKETKKFIYIYGMTFRNELYDVLRKSTRESVEKKKCFVMCNVGDARK